MVILRVKEVYDGRLPEFQVVKEVSACENCGCQKDEVIKTFDSYEEADAFCNKFIAEGNAKDGITPCGEEDPC